MRGVDTCYNKLPESYRRSIHQFIDQLPKYKSHYSSNSTQLYLNPDLTIRELFKLFKEKNPDAPMSETTFRSEFNALNIKIYKPAVDTCVTCDAHQNSTSNLSLTNEECDDDTKEWEAHHARNLAARSLLETKTEEAKHDSGLITFTFDLMSVLPLPYMRSSVFFYKRLLSVYNFGISQKGSKNSGHMYLWSEDQGLRGSNEVASCLIKFLQEKANDDVMEFHSFSDGCTGQNWNKTMVYTMAYAVSKFKKPWTHSFLETGHTFLPNDQEFAKITERRRKCLHVDSLEEYVTLIEACRYQVNRMENNFYDYKGLQDLVSLKAEDDDNEKFLLSKVKWIKFVPEDPLVLRFRYTNDTNVPEKKLSLKIKDSSKILSDFAPNRLYNSRLPIDRKKKEDLMSIMRLVPEQAQEFFRSLPCKEAEDTAIESINGIAED